MKEEYYKCPECRIELICDGQDWYCPMCWLIK